MQYESLQYRPISRRRFILRLLRHGSAALALAVVSILVGMAGYVHYEHISWLDGFLNASMLLAGMGAITVPQSSPGKVFAGCYALYAGLVFIVVAGMILAPVVHRIIHLVHWKEARANRQA